MQSDDFLSSLKLVHVYTEYNQVGAIMVLNDDQVFIIKPVDTKWDQVIKIDALYEAPQTEDEDE